MRGKKWERKAFHCQDGRKRREEKGLSLSLRSAPNPSKPMDYDVKESEFWRTRYLPSGSAIVYKDPDAAADPQPQVAVLVKDTVPGCGFEHRCWGPKTKKQRRPLRSFSSPRRPTYISVSWTLQGYAKRSIRRPFTWDLFMVPPRLFPGRLAEPTCGESRRSWRGDVPPRRRRSASWQRSGRTRSSRGGWSGRRGPSWRKGV